MRVWVQTDRKERFSLIRCVSEGVSVISKGPSHRNCIYRSFRGNDFGNTSPKSLFRGKGISASLVLYHGNLDFYLFIFAKRYV